MSLLRQQVARCATIPPALAPDEETYTAALLGRLDGLGRVWLPGGAPGAGHTVRFSARVTNKRVEESRTGADVAIVVSVRTPHLKIDLGHLAQVKTLNPPAYSRYKITNSSAKKQLDTVMKC